MLTPHRWPVIAAIIIGSLIVFSVVWCLLSCLCGCASCLSCFTSCCSCGSCCGNNHHRSKGYAQPQPQPNPQLQPYPQYASAPPPMYHSTAQPQFAQFDVSGGASKSAQYKYNEDALPAMPSWDTSRQTRTPSGRDLEMDRLNSAAAPMLPKSAHSPYGGDMGMMSGPQYQDTSYHSTPAMSYSDPYAGYSGAGQQSGTIRGGGYEPSVAPPPSYRTAQPSNVSPAIGRKPVSGSWRDI